MHLLPIKLIVLNYDIQDISISYSPSPTDSIILPPTREAPRAICILPLNTWELLKLRPYPKLVKSSIP